MKIKDLFKKNIERDIQGVVTIGNENVKQQHQELDEYVITKENTTSFREFFSRYVSSIDKITPDMGVWITGYFGSGKSHFLKILGYLLANKEVDGRTAISFFEDKIQDEILLANIRKSAKANNKVIIFNIDSKAPNNAKTNQQAIMDIMLRTFNASIGLCETLPWVADFERDLIKDNKYDAFKEGFYRETGKNWVDERGNILLYIRKVSKVFSTLYDDLTEEDAKKYIDNKSNKDAHTTEDFGRMIGDYCTDNKCRVIFLMDEVGQFLGSNSSLMLNLQTCVEDIGKFAGGRAWVVVTSQQQLTDMLESAKSLQLDFSKIQGRFKTRITLSGSDAGEVIRKRILEKTDDAKNLLNVLYEQNRSKLDNLILFRDKPTWRGYKDAEDFVSSYPFASYQFELLQTAFEAIRDHGMSGGRHLASGARSMISAFQDSAVFDKNEDVKVLVPFDMFYQTVEQFVDYNIKMVFERAKDRIGDGFNLRVLKVLFLIKYVKDMPATIERIATLMVSSINEDKLVLQENIKKSLSILEEETFIQKNGDEYNFLTNEEQEVENQIKNCPANESEIKKELANILYDKVFDSDKFRFKNRYDFKLNRAVDNEIKGMSSTNNISLKAVTSYFDNTSDDEPLASESLIGSSVIVDLRDSSLIEELTKVNKIQTYNRNIANQNTSNSVLEILERKLKEASERLKRVEEKIKTDLSTAKIFINGSSVSLKGRDYKTRIYEALESEVQRKFFYLNDVKFSFNNNQDILTELRSDKGLLENINQEGNITAINKIIAKVKSDYQIGKRTSIRQLCDIYSKAPYGWREEDIRGMVATMLKYDTVQVQEHSKIVSRKEVNFGSNLTSGRNLDNYIVYVQEKTAPEILAQVKRIMNNAFQESYSNEESKLKDSVIDFFTRKAKSLQEIKEKYGDNNSYPGKAKIGDLYLTFNKIAGIQDNATLFKTIIEKDKELEQNSDVLDQIISFYKDNSASMQNWNSAREIVKYYHEHCMFDDLTDLEDTIDKINDILKLEIPFNRIHELASYVASSKSIIEKVNKNKLDEILKQLNKDFETITKEYNATKVIEMDDSKHQEIEDLYNSLSSQYSDYEEKIAKAPNADSYIYASRKNVENFKDKITEIINRGGGGGGRTKRVRLINTISVANKKIKTQEDIDKVVKEIKEKLVEELNSSDELDLE
jgi:energy-coupling factor transporter ATP-binding protein EcfA2